MDGSVGGDFAASDNHVSVEWERNFEELESDVIDLYRMEEISMKRVTLLGYEKSLENPKAVGSLVKKLKCVEYVGAWVLLD